MVMLTVYVEDYDTKEKLAGAKITINGKWAKTTYAAGWREWALTPKQTYRIEVSKSGYDTQSMSVYIGTAAEKWVFRLKKSAPPPPTPPAPEPTPEPTPQPAADWPWPLNLVKDWFEGLWNWIGTAVTQACDALWDLIISELKDLSSWLDTTFGWLLEQVSGKVSWLNEQLQTVVSWVWEQVKPELASIAKRVKGIADLSWDKLWKFLEDPAGAVRGFFSNLSDSLLELFLWLNEQLNGALGWLWGKIKPYVSPIKSWIDDTTAWITAAWTDFAKDPKGYIGAGLNSLSSSIQTMFDGAVTSFSTWVTDALNGVANAVGSGFQAFIDWMLKHLTYVAEMIVGAINVVVSRVTGTLTSIFSVFANMITGAVMPKSPPKEVAEAIDVMSEAVWKRQIEIIDKAYESAPSAAGLDAAAVAVFGALLGASTTGMLAGLAADLAHPLKDAGFKFTIRELIYWSGIPSVTAAIAVLPASIGILEPLRYYLFSKWQPMIAPPTDMIRFAVREVFIPEERERLLKPGPGDDYYKYMTWHGFNRFWADAYWASHWVRPTIEQLTEMFYRGTIKREDWLREVRLNDYAPYAIEWLEKIIYAPYTRVDIRRMWDLGLVTDDEVYTNYLWLGYDDEHAKRMLLWTKAYVVAGDVRALYSKGWIDEFGAKQMLVDVGVPAARVDTFMKRLVKVEQAERMSDERDLTKTDILRLLKAGVITNVQAEGMLMDIGYDEDEAAYLVQLTTFQPEVDFKELTQAQILKAYRYEIYNRETAKNKLLEAGWSEAAAETLLKLEDINLADSKLERARERDLSRADIINAINAEIIDLETGYWYLAYLGYSNWEIILIFGLEGLTEEKPGPFALPRPTE